MADVWSHVFTFPAGSETPLPFELGPPDQTESGEWHGKEVSAVLGTLRLGFLERLPAVRFCARIILPDQGTELGPLDLPLLFPVELPIRFWVWPLVASDVDVKIEASAFRGCCSAGTFQATYLLECAAGLNELPQWVIAALPMLGTGVWADAAGNPCGPIVSGETWPSPRPRNAHYILTTTAATMLLFYGL